MTKPSLYSLQVPECGVRVGHPRPLGLPAHGSQAQSPPSLHKYLLRGDPGQVLAGLSAYKMKKTDPELAEGAETPGQLQVGRRVL